MADSLPWRVAGSYYEVCNCEAICPCRQQGGKRGGRSSYGICEFALSWHIREGQCGGVDLTDQSVVLTGYYDDDEPGSPWRVILYVDERARPDQHDALAAIFLGRLGGTTLRNFAAAIGEVYAVRRAHIDLDHLRDRERMRVGDFVVARTATPVRSEETVSCGIPGHDRPGQELVAEVFRVEDPPLRWEVIGRCGFATDFAYTSGG
jgi:hypothetical protein